MRAPCTSKLGTLAKSSSSIAGASGHASAEPGTIDFEHTEGELKGKAWKGIFRLDGDTLTVCDNAPDMEKSRPAAFEAGIGSGYVLVTFERAAP